MSASRPLAILIESQRKYQLLTHVRSQMSANPRKNPRATLPDVRFRRSLRSVDMLEEVMELVGEHTFNAPREKVWDLLLDPAVLKASLPGCEKLEQIGDDEYAATMKIGVAMIKGTFT